jgi:serine protease Do
MKLTRSRALLGGLLAGASALALVSAAPTLAQPDAPAAAPTRAWGQVPNLADLVEQVSPGVVQITARRPGAQMAMMQGDVPELFRDSPFGEFFGREFFDPEFGGPQFDGPQGRGEAPEVRAGGSGFLVDATGIVVTNNHVVEEATHVTVTLVDGRELDAEILGVDPKTDLAVLKVAADGLPAPVRWGDSDAARVGDSVFAMGAPFGLGGTVTAGIVSARGRNLNSGPYDDFIQVDAPINFGNSGGPLFNEAGEVIGVNSQILSPGGQRGGNVGIGFAIPSDLARSVVAEIAEHGAVDRGWLGVSIQPVTKEIADSLGLDSEKGALVAEVTPDSPADKAGIEVGDVITRFGDAEVDDVHDLTRAVADADSGERVRVAAVRDGRERDIGVEVGAMPSDSRPSKQASMSGHGDQSGLAVDRLGMKLADGEGAVVAFVERGGPAAEAGLEPGDRILRVNSAEVDSAESARATIADAASAGRAAVLLQVEREGQKRFVGVPFSVS